MVQILEALETLGPVGADKSAMKVRATASSVALVAVTGLSRDLRPGPGSFGVEKILDVVNKASKCANFSSS